MAVPVPATFYAGQRLRAADVNAQVRDNLNWTISAKTCRAVRNGAYSVGNAAWTAIPLNTEDFDLLAWHDGAGAFPNIIVPNLTGYYQVEGSLGFVANGAGVRRAAIRARTFNAGPYVMASASAPADAANSTTLSVSTVVYCNGSTDYVELLAWQNSGAALNTSVAEFNTSLCATFIGT